MEIKKNKNGAGLIYLNKIEKKEKKPYKCYSNRLFLQKERSFHGIEANRYEYFNIRYKIRTLNSYKVTQKHPVLSR